MLSIDEITSLHLEISSYCVASCPMCPRNFYGMKYNAGYPVTNISLSDFQRVFTSEFVGQLNMVRFNGNLGDFNMNPEAVEIVEYLRSNNQNLDIEINTNGHSRDLKFWRQLADNDPTVLFALDGLEDTHHLHRKGTSYKRVLRNAEEFMAAGGRATWKMIVFDHNKHQVDQCRELAMQMGFSNFKTSNDGRDDAYVFNDDGSHSHTIGKPAYNKPPDAKTLMQWKNENNPIMETEPKKNITCQAKKDKMIYMSSNGDISPCCWLGFSPKTYDENLYHGNKQLKQLIGESKINAVSYGLEEVLKWFSLVQDTWQKKTFKEGRLYRCDLHCGKN